MIDIQARNPTLDDGWPSRATRPAGLYGELPALPAHPPAGPPPLARPLRKSTSAD